MSGDMSNIDLKELVRRIDRAVIYDLAKETPCDLATSISTDKRRIWLKREDLQDVSSLSQAQLDAGVCAASAGNHAQGIAASARHYGAKAVIFMPVTTPPIKVDAVQSFGAQTRLVGDSYDAACAAALDYAKDTGAVFIHPFDEIDVIAGQGTVAKEPFMSALAAAGLSLALAVMSKPKPPTAKLSPVKRAARRL